MIAVKDTQQAASCPAPNSHRPRPSRPLTKPIRDLKSTGPVVGAAFSRWLAEHVTPSPGTEAQSGAHHDGATERVESNEVRLILGDALIELCRLPSGSAHSCITDPPYCLHGLGTNWDAAKIAKHRKGGIVGGQPSGMKFDPRQGDELEAMMRDISREIFRILVPGGFFVSFSQARLYHRFSNAVESSGFAIRDMLAWRYDGQAKAASHDHFVRKMNIDANEKARIIADMGGRKTPQLKPQIEPMVLAQKPLDGTHINNWQRHRTGLVDISQTLDGLFPGQVMTVPKPKSAERGTYNDHPTVKPIALMEHLIGLFSAPGQTVLDPFLGSGTTAVAAIRAGRSVIGIEREPRYMDITYHRIADSRRIEATRS